MKLKLNVSLTALGAVLLGLAAQAQNPATPADHGGNASTQTYPQGAPALRPDSLNNPNSTTNRGDKPNMTRKERRALRRNRDTNRMERNGNSTNQNARTNRSGANMTTYPMEGNAGTTQNDTGTPMKSTDVTGTTNSNAGNQNGNTGINTMGTATTGYTDTTSTTSPARNTNTGTSTGTGNASSNAGNQNGQTGINSQGTSTSGYTGSSTGNTGSTNTRSSANGNITSGTSGVTDPSGAAPGMNTNKAKDVAGNIPNMRTMSIKDYTSASPEYTVLVNALQTTDMTNMLEGAGQFTVFAPSNNAFNKLPATTRSNLLNGKNQEALKQLMSYHVVEGALDSKEIAKRMNEGNGKARLQTVAGGTLIVEMGTNGRLKITDDQGGVAYVESPDHLQSNGVVHGVDKVLLPKAVTARFK